MGLRPTENSQLMTRMRYYEGRAQDWLDRRNRGMRHRSNSLCKFKDAPSYIHRPQIAVAIDANFDLAAAHEVVWLWGMKDERNRSR